MYMKSRHSLLFFEVFGLLQETYEILHCASTVPSFLYFSLSLIVSWYFKINMVYFKINMVLVFTFQ